MQRVGETQSANIKNERLTMLGTPHLLTVEEYMTVQTEATTELLGGIIYDVSPVNPPHRFAVNRLAMILSRGLSHSYMVQVQSSIAVPDWKGKDAPNPDIAIIDDRYAAGTSADTHVFIEVSDSTYRTDRCYKIPLYVNAGVPSYIVNIEHRWVEYYPDTMHLEFKHGAIHTAKETIQIMGVYVDLHRLFKPE